MTRTETRLHALKVEHKKLKRLYGNGLVSRKILTVQNEMLLEKVARLQDELFEKEMTWRICGRVV